MAGGSSELTACGGWGRGDLPVPLPPPPHPLSLADGDHCQPDPVDDGRHQVPGQLQGARGQEIPQGHEEEAGEGESVAQPCTHSHAVTGPPGHARVLACCSLLHALTYIGSRLRRTLSCSCAYTPVSHLFTVMPSSYSHSNAFSLSPIGVFRWGIFPLPCRLQQGFPMALFSPPWCAPGGYSGLPDHWPFAR